jgi:hypothetical protein
VVAGRQAGAVVDLFTCQKQNSPVFTGKITLAALDQYIVVGDNDNINPRLQCSPPDLLMASSAVGIDGVHVEVGDELSHLVVDDFRLAKV